MSLAPELFATGDPQQRLFAGLADVQRQVNNILQTQGAIPAGGVGAGQVAPGTITATEIAAGTIVAGNIAAGTITGTLIAANTITAGNIVSNTITAGQIAAHTITATELAATAIDGMTITGSTIRTSSTAGTTGAGVVINTLGIKGYDATATQKFNLDATTGLIQAQGVILAQAGSVLPVNTIAGLLPGSSNRYSNSAFQNGASTFDTTGWTVTNASASSGGTTAPPVYNSLTLQLTTTGSGAVTVKSSTISDPFKRVLPGLNYSFSHYVYPTSTARSSSIDVNWYNSAGTLLSTTTGTSQTTTLNAWTRITQTATAPAGAAFALGTHNIGLAAVSTEVFYTECFQMEEGDRVSAWAPRPDEILVNQINAVNINVSSLSAISANLGTITAGSITGVTITGATVQTAATAPRIAMDTTGLWFTNGSATKVMQIDTTWGVQLLGGSGTANFITWVSSGVGAHSASNIVAEIQASSVSGTNYVNIGSATPTSLLKSVIGINSDDTTDTANGIYVQTWNAAGTAGFNKTIVDGSGRGDFVNAGNGLSPAHITATANSVSWAGSSGISTSTFIVGSRNFTNGAYCLVTPTLSGLGFGISCSFKADYNASSNPPSFYVTGYTPGVTPTAGQTHSFYALIYVW